MKFVVALVCLSCFTTCGSQTSSLSYTSSSSSTDSSDFQIENRVFIARIYMQGSSSATSDNADYMYSPVSAAESQEIEDLENELITCESNTSSAVASPVMLLNRVGPTASTRSLISCLCGKYYAISRCRSAREWNLLMRKFRACILPLRRKAKSVYNGTPRIRIIKRRLLRRLLHWLHWIMILSYKR
ncbi:hypothetical protein ScPMuIL_017201 [Solemya velum]